MLKRDIRIGDKTPSKISLGKDEPTSICLGDKLIWGGVDDTVDVTVYVDNPEVFNDENSYAVIIIGDKSVSIDRNHNGPFQFKTTLEDNRVVTNYLSHSSNLSDDVEIIVNGSVGAAYLGTVGFIYGFRIGNNEVHIKFKEALNNKLIQTTVYIDNPEVFKNSNVYAEILIGGYTMMLYRGNSGPFRFNVAANEHGQVEFKYASHSEDLANQFEVITDKGSYTIVQGNITQVITLNLVRDEVHIKLKEVPKEEYVDATVYIDNPEPLMDTFNSAIIEIGGELIQIQYNYDKKPFNIKAKLKDSRVELCYKEITNNRNIFIEIDVNGFSYFFRDTNSCTMSDMFKRNYNNIVHIKFQY